MIRSKGIEGYIPVLSQRQMVRESIASQFDDLSKLPAMPQLQILCGRNGGLPFDYLMTDVISGCLPVKAICYGNCSSADHWFSQGYDFGKRTLNRFDRDTFVKSAKELPPSQKWLRQGWASDCSFSEQSWELVRETSDLLATLGISMLVITKGYRQPSDHVLQNLARNGTELRLSISATDSKAHLSQRTHLLERYKDAGGKAVPYLMSAKYSDPTLTANQDAIVKWIEVGDYIAAEHPLRLNKDNRAIPYLAADGFYHAKFSDEYWFGRLYNNHPSFRLPPPTHLQPGYTLPYKSLSEANGKTIEHLDGNLPTYDDLKAGRKINLDNLNKHGTYGVKLT